MAVFELTDHDAHVVREFLEAYFSLFSSHCGSYADRGQEPEEYADQILKNLGAEI
ncbi:hypothetical protein ACJVQT_23170 [Enterobacter huaxiensis]|uniref:hypothetical protein n=1 Tax=Enterobacter huaxiensis TaxID=2494702 RepID=UPI002175BB4C|nr:hypothetical protein [Enterobacter huaxiensis]MCS5452480.1 hypothetical protein [Enterobacter huaxiensis]